MGEISLFCKFYLKTNLSCEWILNIISKHFKQPIKSGSVEIGDIAIDCFKNLTQARGETGFLYWRCCLELIPVDEDHYDDFDEFLSLAKELNNLLRANNIRTVVSCDFEEEFDNQLDTIF
ncbi:hypothetical protein [Zophobihabitans entericus]|uniref:Uncharacterized protein n=1 Tax=Zophobihabitans entericus TaxID=1635327 RepID=A0A6G9IC44_9GAMM|nr:hypothetical protein [Zophobihabitans entericus]QIQ21407.1 hypothetical protein IPMB12_06720 [Zophobihabitans entericus]